MVQVSSDALAAQIQAAPSSHLESRKTSMLCISVLCDSWLQHTTFSKNIVNEKEQQNVKETLKTKNNEFIKPSNFSTFIGFSGKRDLSEKMKKMVPGRSPEEETKRIFKIFCYYFFHNQQLNHFLVHWFKKKTIINNVL